MQGAARGPSSSGVERNKNNLSPRDFTANLYLKTELAGEKPVFSVNIARSHNVSWISLVFKGIWYVTYTNVASSAAWKSKYSQKWMTKVKINTLLIVTVYTSQYSMLLLPWLKKVLLCQWLFSYHDSIRSRSLVLGKNHRQQRSHWCSIDAIHFHSSCHFSAVTLTGPCSPISFK